MWHQPAAGESSVGVGWQPVGGSERALPSKVGEQDKTGARDRTRRERGQICGAAGGRRGKAAGHDDDRAGGWSWLEPGLGRGLAAGNFSVACCQSCWRGCGGTHRGAAARARARKKKKKSRNPLGLGPARAIGAMRRRPTSHSSLPVTVCTSYRAGAGCGVGTGWCIRYFQEQLVLYSRYSSVDAFDGVVVFFFRSSVWDCEWGLVQMHVCDRYRALLPAACFF